MATSRNLAPDQDDRIHVLASADGITWTERAAQLEGLACSTSSLAAGAGAVILVDAVNCIGAAISRGSDAP